MATQDIVTFETKTKVFSNWVFTCYGILVNLNYCKSIHIEKFDGGFQIIAYAVSLQEEEEADEWIIDYFEEYKDAVNYLVELLGKSESLHSD